MSIYVSVGDVVVFMFRNRKKSGVVSKINPLTVYCKKRGGHHQIDPSKVVKNISRKNMAFQSEDEYLTWFAQFM